MSDVAGVMMSSADARSPQELVADVHRIEEMGYPAVWLVDPLGREIYVTAAHLLAATSSIAVATGVASIYGRDPTATAQAARTLTELSGGRFIQGLGVSDPFVAQLRGADWENPIAKMQGYLQAMTTAPLPPVDQRAPIHIAANGPRMIGVAAELADGAITYLMPSEHTSDARQRLGPDKTLTVCMPCCLTSSAATAYATARRELALDLPNPSYLRRWRNFGFTPADVDSGGSERLIDALVAWGDAQAIRAAIDRYLDAGASQVVLVPYAPDNNESQSIWGLLGQLAPTT